MILLVNVIVQRAPPKSLATHVESKYIIPYWLFKPSYSITTGPHPLTYCLSHPRISMHAKPTILLTHSKLPADVEIIIFSQRYHLHSAVLRLFSGFFDGSLSGTWWKPENTIPGPSPIKYRYGLSRDESGDLMLVPVGPDVSSSGEGGERSLVTDAHPRWCWRMFSPRRRGCRLRRTKRTKPTSTV